ncbi:MAG: alpha/beta fold hydrolase [Thermodesulfobacteriota bacterium]
MSPESISEVFAAALPVAALGVVWFSWEFARRWCAPEKRVSLMTPADYDLFFEHVRFVSGGVPLCGWFVPARTRDRPRPAVIVAHGWSSNASEMLQIATVLHEEDFGVLLFDARGHGVSGSDGSSHLGKFSEDIRAAVEYLHTRVDVDTSALGVLGHSIAGSAAIVAASEDPRIRAVVSLSAFADPDVTARDYVAKLHIPSWPFGWLVCRFIEVRAGAPMEFMAPLHRVGQLTVPLMLIHGASDRMIPRSDMDVLYHRARKQCSRRVVIENRGHSDLPLDPQCVRSAAEFLRTSLPSDDPDKDWLSMQAKASCL